jgi:hypothetical protein|tara:strand:+ start:404 stop:598 length:195 start_codon:yes stop_codon:yes gene_type:complete
MMNYQLVLEETVTKRREQITIQAAEFSSAASQAYLKKHTLTYNEGAGWKIISLSERGWGIINLP